MRLNAIKTVAQVEEAIRTPVTGRAHVELVTVDGSIRGVRIGRAHFTIESYSFAARVEVDFEEQERHRVTAKVAGFPDAVDYFEDLYAARAKRDSYPDIAEVTIDAVKVLVNEAGEVVGEAGAVDLPF